MLRNHMVAGMSVSQCGSWVKLNFGDSLKQTLSFYTREHIWVSCAWVSCACAYLVDYILPVLDEGESLTAAACVLC